MINRATLLGGLSLSLTLLVLPACRKETPKTQRAVVEVSAEALPRVNAKLAAVDAMDGTPDKVVSKCAGCGLAMDGKPQFVLAVGDYDMHFCSEHCRNDFTSETADKVLALDVPGDKNPAPDADDDGQ